MRKGDWGKVKAFFDVSTQEGIVIKGFRLVEGINGLFASMPSRKGSDEQGNDKWFDTVWIESRALRETLNQEAINAFNGSTENQPINKQNTTFTLEETEMLKDDLINQLKINQQLMAENIELREKLLEIGGVKAKRPGFLKKK